MGQETGAIFNFHLGLLDDPTLLETFYTGIEKNRFTAEYAVSRSLREYSKQFLKQKDVYFRERVKDIYDIERRLIHKLQGKERVRLSEITEPVCLVAHDLTPSQTASLDRTKIRAICIDAGGRTSHTAIIANSMGIPAVVGLENITQEVNPGDTLIVNGQSGVVIINPDEATLEEHRQYEARQVQFETLPRARCAICRRKTKDGTEITLMGNIEFPARGGQRAGEGGDGDRAVPHGISLSGVGNRADGRRSLRGVCGGHPASSAGGPSSSGRWTWGPTSTRRGRSGTRRTIRFSAAGRSGCAWRTWTCSRCSCGRSCGRACWAMCG